MVPLQWRWVRQYAWLTTKHKVFVFLAGLRTRAPIWNLLIHDLSKYSWTELPHYARQFFGAKDDPEGFAEAWLHHQNVNPHHWEYWIARTMHVKGPLTEPVLPMPMWAVREMMADWMGASRAYSGAWPVINDDKLEWPWLEQEWPKISPRMHLDTRNRLRMVLCEMTPHWATIMPLDTNG